MLKLFEKHRDILIKVTDNEEESVFLAATDLQKDLRRLSGQENAFSIVTECGAPCIHIINNNRIYAPIKTEGYTVFVNESGVVIAGYDSLGTIYGIYSFCEKMLKISPMQHITGLFPAVKEEFCLENTSFSDYPRGSRFRGWFINDEDLLTDFCSGGGKREIDYQFYDNIIHSSVIEIILETALRLKMNLIIPSSFVDIENPDEENLIRMACRRGMYITQHHVEPVGVSYFAAENYMKRHGIDGQVSFLRNRECMEKIWRYYAKKWAIYGKQVIWQLGLRGRADVPVWYSDKNIPVSDEERGKIIGGAIELQCQIINEVVGADFHSTSTLWKEGADLYEKGCLSIPEKTIIIFSDVGGNQMFSSDFYNIPRSPGHQYGVYYHAAYWGDGPHLAEGCSPEKMMFSYSEALKYNSLYYSILNVSNLREVHLSAWFNSELVWSPEDFCMKTFIKDKLLDIYGDCAKKVEIGYRKYYNAFVDLGSEVFKAHCDRWGYRYHEHGILPFVNYVANDGGIRKYGLSTLKLDFSYMLSDENIGKFRESEKKFAELLNYWKTIEKEIPEHVIEYYKAFPVLQTNYMLLMTRWLLGCTDFAAKISENNTIAASGKAKDAASHLQEILVIRQLSEKGKWQGWYEGDKKINVEKLIKVTLEAGRCPLQKVRPHRGRSKNRCFFKKYPRNIKNR